MWSFVVSSESSPSLSASVVVARLVGSPSSALETMKTIWSMLPSASVSLATTGPTSAMELVACGRPA